ncbi:hypothetical protein HanHA300_Chr06g0225531 [Helianthus annuus]|nr:hypothetical protein HanHA300_Chr06g0225531 [Helianthus annuus]KAJ0574724.1 hypothetical protein HanHA89_Chr06g0241481 [Helianthus annuus]KAJ0739055.1 hypothetical protein HanLR1_Chr06g0225391 [Helianthus annuus]KAJ0741916.1 hypothetical protein HanOQP8_Chr06g0233591 [Helianthus annuus]
MERLNAGATVTYGATVSYGGGHFQFCFWNQWFPGLVWTRFKAL